MSTPLPFYKIVRASRRSISLEISHKNGLVVRAPFSVPEDILHAFVERKSDWIHKHLTRQAETRNHAPENIYYKGSIQAFEYSPLSKTPITHMDGIFIFSEKIGTSGHEKQMLEKWYRKEARDYFTNRVKFFSEKYGFSYQDIRITGALTRWGSCSARNNLNFPWRLLMAPDEVIDYVIVHELCHTVHKNHSVRFWNLVATIVPDWKIHRHHLQKEWWKYTLPSFSSSK